MKKILALTLILAMTASLAACNKDTAVSDTTAGTSVTNADGTPKVTSDSKTIAKQIDCRIEGSNLIFTVSSKIALEVDAWIGICEKGSYVFEEDADDAGVNYGYYNERESESEDYVFEVETGGIEDGEYTMVLCNTENAGYVMASWVLTLKGGKPSVDLSGFKLNPKPANIPTPAEPAEPVDPDEEDDDDDDGYDGSGDYDEDEDDGEDDGDDDGEDDVNVSENKPDKFG